jgi:uncharacterized protein YcgI (DUF1989 family)
MDQGRIVETTGPETYFTNPTTERARQFLARYGSERAANKFALEHGARNLARISALNPLESEIGDFDRSGAMLGQLPPGEIIGDEILPARAYWHRRLHKSTVLRIVDLEGCQSVDTLIYDAADTAVRYNAANTMKLAGSVYLSKGCVIYDDLAQPLMTMIEDTVGRHDTLAGNCSREINLVRYGKPGSLSCRTTSSRRSANSAWDRGIFRQTSTSS